MRGHLKIYFVFFLNGIVLSPGNLDAQQSVLDKTISIHEENQALRKVLVKISEIGGFHFSYSNEKIPVQTIVSIHANNWQVRKVFDELFQDMDIDYLEVEGEIILKKKIRYQNNSIKKILKKFTLSGYVWDQLTGESLIGATVSVADSTIGTITNAFGFYSITLEQGSYQLIFSYIGYKKFRTSINLDENHNKNVDLFSDPASIDEIVITNNDRIWLPGLIETSKMNIKPQTVREVPALFGEVDVLKSLESVPGITFFGDGSTLFFVRGGNRDQNMIKVDDAPVFNPAHMFGFFSNISPDVVKDINIYKGDMPASMGGRLSSMIDLRTKDGNKQRFGMSGGLGFVSAHLTMEGPLVKDKSSFFISGRRSYFEWLARKENPNMESIYFGDLNSKLNIQLNTKNRLFISGYYGTDNYFNKSGRTDASGIKWGNISGSVRWNHLFSEKLFSNSTFYAAKYDYYLVTSEINNDTWNSKLENAGLKTDFTWYNTPSSTLKFGLAAAVYWINPGNFTYGSSDGDQGNIPYVPERKSLEWIAYINYQQLINEHWSFRLGLRNSLWQNTGKTTEFVFNEKHQPVDTIHNNGGGVYHSYFRPEPRISLAYGFNKYNSLNLSYSRNIQNLHQVTNSVSPFTTLEIWLPSGPNLKPQVSDQVSLGFFKSLPGTGLKFSIESYYKIMRNQIDYEYHAKMLLNPLVEGELRFGEARAYGLELMIRKDVGKLTGWIGYSLSKTTKLFNEIYKGEPFPAFYDRPNDFSIFVSYKLGSRWLFSAMWVYTSGAAFSSPSSFYYYQGYTVPIYTEKNNDRLPDYHRLDCALNFKLGKPKKKFQHDLTLSLFNVYGRKNPLFINFNKTSDQGGNIVVPSNYLPSPDLFPSQIWLYQFVPSLNYNFRF